MKVIRWILGRIILLLEALTMPKGVVRDEISQTVVDKKTEQYSLYQFEACPFCVKVRRTINKNSLSIEYRDAKNNHSHRDALAEFGGQIKVPCLRIFDDKGEEKWIYESNTIIEHLEEVAAVA